VISELPEAFASGGKPNGESDLPVFLGGEDCEASFEVFAIASAKDRRFSPSMLAVWK